MFSWTRLPRLLAAATDHAVAITASSALTVALQHSSDEWWRAATASGSARHERAHAVWRTRDVPEDDGVVAEVFAAVTPANNQKLREDIKKVRAASQKHRYVLFMSPGHREGPVSHQLAGNDVSVWSLGPAR